MRRFQFQFSLNAESMFASLERFLQKRILKKMTFWEKTKNPLSFAKPLQTNENIWSFRIGDYRIIVIQKNNNRDLVILLIVKIGHRREVYE